MRRARGGVDARGAGRPGDGDGAGLHPVESRAGAALQVDQTAASGAVGLLLRLLSFRWRRRGYGNRLGIAQGLDFLRIDKQALNAGLHLFGLDDAFLIHGVEVYFERDCVDVVAVGAVLVLDAPVALDVAGGTQGIEIGEVVRFERLAGAVDVAGGGVAQRHGFAAPAIARFAEHVRARRGVGDGQRAAEDAGGLGDPDERQPDAGGGVLAGG